MGNRPEAAKRLRGLWLFLRVEMSMFSRRQALILGASGTLFACTPASKPGNPVSRERFGKVEVFADSLSDLIDPSAELEQLGEGYVWSEGPAWDAKRNTLYFSDVPTNTAYKWTEEAGIEIFRKPSGLADDADATGISSAGSNGLYLTRDGRLLSPNHGGRSIDAIDLDTGDVSVLFDRYDGKRLNSPNDIVEAADGTLYFTDPPYGLEGQDDSPLKEQLHNGVYKAAPDGELSLIETGLRRPNGIELSPDGRTLYVANSDRDRQIIKSYAIKESGEVEDLGVFFDATSLVAADAPGLPDGMCVAKSGHIYATGPGGVLVLTAQGELLGRINPGRPCANCTIGNDGKMLYLTAANVVARLPLK